MAWIGAAKAPAGCVFCSVRDKHDDRKDFVLERGKQAFLMVNLYPYASGHLMVVLNRHVDTVTAAETDELTDMMRLAQRAVAALRAEYRPPGFNIGLNQGSAAGAGIADHLHMHVVPRWNGDAGFMGVVGNTRILPETLETTWERLKGRLSG